MLLEEIFEPDTLAHRAVEVVTGVVRGEDDVTIRVTRSQVAFRRRRGFAFVWRPAQWHVSGPEAVLSIAVPWRIESNRFREVVQPSPTVWMHHLGLAGIDDIDAEVEDWLRSAAAAAG